MSVREAQEPSLRPSRLEFSRVAWAIVLSLALHLLIFGGYKVGEKFHIWQSLHLPVWMQKAKSLSAVAIKKNEAAKTAREVPLVFVDVNPQVATPEAPKDAKFYSDKNSKAANPDAEKETGIPKITGEQTQVAKAEDVPRSKFDKLQPAFPKPQPEEPAEQAKPKSPTPGDLTMAKPDVTLRPNTGTDEHTRPRTIKEALMRQNRNQLAGQKMKQNGGVNRLSMTSLDAKATPFGAYDAAFIESVEDRWFGLLDNMSYNGYRRGRVVLQFRLNYDGRITDMKVVENTVGETLGLLCQKAVLDPAPFEKWPREMRLMVDKDYREIQFAFYYN